MKQILYNNNNRKYQTNKFNNNNNFNYNYNSILHKHMTIQNISLFKIMRKN